MDPRSTLVLACCAAALLASCGGEESPSAVSEPATTAPAPPEPAALEPREQAKSQAPEEREPEPRAKPSEAGKQSAADGAAGAYTDYVEAIDARDGEALCALLPPGAERELRPPVERGGCAASLAASIGYEDPRGFPVWAGTTLNAIQRLAIGADRSTVRLTAMIVTDFEGREPSVESDIAYLERAGGEWRLAQPTAALYRAIGNPEPPPTVIAPPG